MIAHKKGANNCKKVWENKQKDVGSKRRWFLSRYFRVQALQNSLKHFFLFFLFYSFKKNIAYRKINKVEKPPDSIQLNKKKKKKFFFFLKLF